MPSPSEQGTPQQAHGLQIPNPVAMPDEHRCIECGALVVRTLSAIWGIVWIAISPQEIPGTQCPKAEEAFGVHGQHRVD